jgi:Leucine-rich repeat (LRR) protein
MPTPAENAFVRAKKRVANAKRRGSKVIRFGDLKALERLPSLEGLTSLVEISISGTLVEDISPIGACVSLQKIFAGGVPIRDADALSSLYALREVYLHGTNISRVPLLSRQGSLTVLTLADTKVSDISLDLSFESLKRLDLTRTAIRDLTPLENATKLDWLQLRGTNVSDLGPLSKLGALSNLDIRDSAVSDFSPLSSMPSLRWLLGDKTQVRELEPIASLTNLFGLTIRNTLVYDLKPLRKLDNLISLAIDGTRVSDLAPLVELTKLANHRRLRYTLRPLNRLRYQYPFRNSEYLRTINYSYSDRDNDIIGIELSSDVEDGLSFEGCPLRDQVLLELGRIANPERTVATIDYLRRQHGLPSLSELAEAQRQENLPLPGIEDPRPINNVPSPFGFRLSASGTIALTVSSANVPIFPLQRSIRDHANRLDVCRRLCEDLVGDLKERKFQVRDQYGESLKHYAARLPSAPDDGNILLADAEARTIRNLFSAEADVLSIAFASKLKTFLEQHIGLRVFYPEVASFYRDVQSGRIDDPLPLDAVDGVLNGVRDNTPEVFDPSVHEAMDESLRPISESVGSTVVEIVPGESSLPLPPKDPLGEVSPQKANDFTFAGAANNLWKAFLEGDRIYKAVEGWRKAGDALRPHMSEIVNWLYRFLGSGTGGPPNPPTISV